MCNQEIQTPVQEERAESEMLRVFHSMCVGVRQRLDRQQ